MCRLRSPASRITATYEPSPIGKAHPRGRANGDGGVFRNPHHRRLEALRAGEPVSVPAFMLPRFVRESPEYQSAYRGVGRYGTTIHRPQTATVWPSGRIVYRKETVREWVDEHMPGEL